MQDACFFLQRSRRVMYTKLSVEVEKLFAFSFLFFSDGQREMLPWPTVLWINTHNKEHSYWWFISTLLTVLIFSASVLIRGREESIKSESRSFSVSSLGKPSFTCSSPSLFFFWFIMILKTSVCLYLVGWTKYIQSQVWRYSSAAQPALVSQTFPPLRELLLGIMDVSASKCCTDLKELAAHLAQLF